MKKNKVLLAASFFLVLAFSWNAPNEKTFPVLTANNLKGTKITLPIDAKGKFALIGIASSMKAQNDLETWVEPVYGTLADNPTFFVNMYLVPLLKDINSMNSETLIKKMKDGLDPDLHQYVLPYTGETSIIKSSLGIKDNTKPYLFLLSPGGNIIYNCSGAYDEKTWDIITDKMSE